jgi:hypothetical protein
VARNWFVALTRRYGLDVVGGGGRMAFLHLLAVQPALHDSLTVKPALHHSLFFSPPLMLLVLDTSSFSALLDCSHKLNRPPTMSDRLPTLSPPEYMMRDMATWSFDALPAKRPRTHTDDQQHEGTYTISLRPPLSQVSNLTRSSQPTDHRE